MTFTKLNVIEEMHFSSENAFRISEEIIKALKDMEHYESFCAFCRSQWKATGKSGFKKNSGSKLLNKYFYQIEHENTIA